MRVEAVVFDIGGVLEVNPRTGWQERWAARLGMPPDRFRARLEPVFAAGSVGGASLGEIERRTAEAFGLDAVSLRALMDDVWGEYLGTLNTELASYFIGLRRAGRVRTAILSNSFVGAREREEALYGFEEMCDAVVYSHEVGCLKPDPRIYRAVCQRLGVAPGAAVLLDDLLENVEGALRVGMRGIVLRENRQAIAELEALLNA